MIVVTDRKSFLHLNLHLCQVSLSDARLLRRPYASRHCHSANRGGFGESMEHHHKPSSALKDDHTHNSFITGHVFSPSLLPIRQEQFNTRINKVEKCFRFIISLSFSEDNQPLCMYLFHVPAAAQEENRE